MTLFPVVILAGGLGTRIASLANNTPKSLLPIDGQAFLKYQLLLLVSQKVRNVVLCVGNQAAQIIDAVTQWNIADLNISYHHDGDCLLGTGGAIQAAMPALSDHFFVLYGDSYLTCDYRAIQQCYENSGKLGLMTVYKNNHQWDRSNVCYEAHSIVAYDKKNTMPTMQHIDYGLSIFSKKAFSSFTSHKQFDLSLVHQALLLQHELAAFEVFERFYEIGSVLGVDEFKQYIRESQ